MTTIPAALQTHLDTQTTTLCYLLKIVPEKVAAFGVTSLDVDFSYDDGGGSVTYLANPGLNQSSIESSADLGVNNSEAMLLLTSPFTDQQISAGVLDYAQFFIYRINWKDDTMGHFIIQSGRTGAIRSDDELSGVIELRGIPQQLKQNFIDIYSLTCRARFGSEEGDELFPCLFSITSLWSNGTVNAVGTEADRTFTASIAPAATGPNGALPFDVAIIEFLTGTNAGLTAETETISGTAITLRFQTVYDMTVGDTYRIRPDCEKRFAEDCVTLFDNGLNFRGEPWIPVSEEATSQSPGANVPGTGAPPIANTTGSVSWLSYFEVDFLDPIADVIKVIPDSGKAVLFTVPVTTDSWLVVFGNISVTSVAGTRTGAVNRAVLDFTTPPTHVWGTGQGISAGINYPGQDIDLEPGASYIFNFKNDTPAGNNEIRMQVVAQQQ